MARKSRYPRRTNTSAIHSSLVKVGIYTRISVSAKNGDSESIINQFQIATNYIDHSEDLEYVKTYSDDGYTGRHFNRPGFQEMMQDAKAGLINCIMVKDISRLGRNYLTIGRLLYEVFPEQNIRFISINDNYDSAKNHEVEKILSKGFLLGRSEAMIADYENQIAKIDVDVNQFSEKQNELSAAMVDAYEAYRDNRITKEAFSRKVSFLAQSILSVRRRSGLYSWRKQSARSSSVSLHF